MNYKHSLAALAVASVVSGQAMAGDSADAVNALIALGSTITTTGYAGLDSDVNTATSTWATVADDATACALGGVLCDGSNNITKLEIPNLAFAPAGGLPDVLTALDPIKDTLINLNLSNTTGPNNVLAGGFAGLDGYVALQKLALNNTSASGVFPDMAAATSLNWINIGYNDAITGMDGVLAGGGAITFVQATDNTAMSGDMTATLANLDNVSTPNVQLGNTGLYGTFEAVHTTGVVVTDSNMIVTGAGAAASGYVAANVVQPATGATATGGEETLSAQWVENAVGTQTSYVVSYSADGGETLEGTTTIAAGTGTYTFSDVDADSYITVVQATDGSSFAAPALSTAVDVIAGPVECLDGEVMNETTGVCEEEEVEEEEEEEAVSGGGGAALWLVMLPLMGLFRRKRA